MGVNYPGFFIVKNAFELFVIFTHGKPSERNRVYLETVLFGFYKQRGILGGGNDNLVSVFLHPDRFVEDPFFKTTPCCMTGGVKYLI